MSMDVLNILSPRTETIQDTLQRSLSWNELEEHYNVDIKLRNAKEEGNLLPANGIVQQSALSKRDQRLQRQLSGKISRILNDSSVGEGVVKVEPDYSDSSEEEYDGEKVNNTGKKDTSDKKERASKKEGIYASPPKLSLKKIGKNNSAKHNKKNREILTSSHLELDVVELLSPRVSTIEKECNISLNEQDIYHHKAIQEKLALQLRRNKNPSSPLFSDDDLALREELREEIFSDSSFPLHEVNKLNSTTDRSAREYEVKQLNVEELLTPRVDEMEAVLNRPLAREEKIIHAALDEQIKARGRHRSPLVSPRLLEMQSTGSSTLDGEKYEASIPRNTLNAMQGLNVHTPRSSLTKEEEELRTSLGIEMNKLLLDESVGEGVIEVEKGVEELQPLHILSPRVRDVELHLERELTFEEKLHYAALDDQLRKKFIDNTTNNHDYEVDQCDRYIEEELQNIVSLSESE